MFLLKISNDFLVYSIIRTFSKFSFLKIITARANLYFFIRLEKLKGKAVYGLFMADSEASINSSDSFFS